MTNKVFDAAIEGYGAQTAHSVTVFNTGNQATGALTIALSGTNPTNFALSKNSIADIAVSGSDSFTVVPNTGLAEGTYTAIVTVSGGADIISRSFNVSFTVDAATPVITITAQPISPLPFAEGSITGSISVSASVTQGATLTYQWYSNTYASNTGGDAIGGATNANFAIPTTLTAAGSPYYYYCVVSATGAVSVPSDVSTVTVLAIPVTGVKLNTNEIFLAIGASNKLTETVEPENAANKNVTWLSSAPDIASVSTNGLVTGEKTGEARITVRTQDGNFEAYCYVTVSLEGGGPGIPIIVEPDYPSDKGDISDKTGINNDNLTVINGKVYLNKALAEKIAKELLRVDDVDTYILPIFEGTTQLNNDIVGLKFTLKGKDFLALHPEDVNLIGMISGSAGKLLDYVNNMLDFGDGKFTILFNGAVFDGVFDPDKNYELVVFIKDFGIFDLDRVLNGKVIASIFLASERTIGGGKKGGGGGCNADYGLFALALLGLIPFASGKR
jgi:hypothetical protein